ncbi:calcium-dependent lipid-binding family protein [Striga asiatica]|uniref:Calcium-dependent lipid-binding family protein n=1 Tax=Striga asiatica TaxID=4170 RepID=A0A5A7Q6R2_STRAF|nr:calcium-dependent lipid-binding family protein [Striga asiatica]
MESRFTYNHGTFQESEQSFSAILQVYVHNICIHDNKDMHAKFSFTYNPDETLSTRIINKNPDLNFDERLIMKIRQADAVLKCEIWNDQLLGFALVPISSVPGKGKVTRIFDLSSTDLFHSPAGTVKLSLSLDPESLITTIYPEKGGFFEDLSIWKKKCEENGNMGKQIVDMYMRSMQQFTESLAKMKLPMELDKPKIMDGPRDLIQDDDEKIEMEKEKREINARVFYGSRAFF